MAAKISGGAAVTTGRPPEGTNAFFTRLRKFLDLRFPTNPI